MAFQADLLAVRGDVHAHRASSGPLLETPELLGPAADRHSAYPDPERAGGGLALQDVGGRAPGGDPSPVEQRHAWRPSGRARQVVDHGEDRHAPLPHVVENAEEAQLVAHVEVGRRLVEEQHPRVLGEAAGEEGELPLPGGEGPERPAGEVLDLGLPEGAGDGGAVLVREGRERPAVRVAAEGDAVLDGDAVRRFVLGGDEGDTLREPRAAARPRAAGPRGGPRPAPGARSPARVRTRVDLPAAFGPTRARPRRPGARGRRRAARSAGRARPTGRASRAPRSSPSLLTAQGEEEVGRADEGGDGTEGQLDVLPEGAGGHVGHHDQHRAGQERGGQEPSAQRAHEAAQRVRRDEANEGDGARHRRDRARHERTQAEDHDPHAVHRQAEGRRLLLAERQDVERTREEQERPRPRQDEARGQPEVLVAAAFEPAGEPEEHGAHAELLGGHEQDRRAGCGQRAHREAREQEARERRPPAGVRDRVDEEQGDEGAGAGGERHGEEALLRPAEVDGEDGAEGGARAHAEEARVRDRVAEERLQGRPDRRQAAAHQGGDEHAREAHRPQDHLAALGSGLGPPRPRRARAERRTPPEGSGTLPRLIATRRATEDKRQRGRRRRGVGGRSRSRELRRGRRLRHARGVQARGEPPRGLGRAIGERDQQAVRHLDDVPVADGARA